MQTMLNAQKGRLDSSSLLAGSRIPCQRLHRLANRRLLPPLLLALCLVCLFALEGSQGRINRHQHDDNLRDDFGSRSSLEPGPRAGRAKRAPTTAPSSPKPTSSKPTSSKSTTAKTTSGPAMKIGEPLKTTGKPTPSKGPTSTTTRSALLAQPPTGVTTPKFAGSTSDTFKSLPAMVASNPLTNTSFPEPPKQRPAESPNDFQKRWAAWERSIKEWLENQKKMSRPKYGDSLQSGQPAKVDPAQGKYDAHAVARFLDSHEAHTIHDPRIYLTNMPPLGALARMATDMGKMPEKFKIAYLMRAFHEWGQKFASRLNTYNTYVISTLMKKSDGLGSHPGILTYVDAMMHAFNGPESKGASYKDQPGTPAPRQPSNATITSLIGADKTKRTLIDSSLNELSKEFSWRLGYLLLSATRNINAGSMAELVDQLFEALKNGAREMVTLMNMDEKVKPPWDVVDHMNQILNRTMTMLRKKAAVADLLSFKTASQTAGAYRLNSAQGLSDSISLVGAWNSYLFYNLGTAERVVRLFASFLASINESRRKNRFINTYFPQVKTQLARTMSSFVSLMGLAPEKGPSEKKLLKTKYVLKNGSRDGIPPMTDERAKRLPQYADKNRLPARCYLAGRRWRLILNKAMKHYDKSEEVVGMFVERINQIKTKSTGPGYSLEKLCLPRLEVGLKGWGINGEPAGEVNAAENKFPLKAPIEGLNKDEDPFTGGARFGYRLGFMIGYNEKRNQSLEMESSDTKPDRHKTREEIFTSAATTQSPKDAKRAEKKNNEIDYLAKASYRRGLTAGARQALEVGCREGYMATLRISLRAGMLLPLEAGSSLASLKGANFGSEAGGEAGRTFVNKYLLQRDNMDENSRTKLMELGKTHGSLAGRQIGDTVGAIAGHESALEAYRRTISRGGKMTRAKFHLDEYLAGVIVGFDYGAVEGGRVAQSANIDPSAPKFFKLNKPQFSAKVSAAFGSATGKKEQTSPTGKPKDMAATGSRGGLIELPSDLPTTSASTRITEDHWVQDLITPLTDKNIEDFHKARNHTRVTGTLKGTYIVAKEIKKGLQRAALANLTYNLDIKAVGFTMDDMTYLSLSGAVNNAHVLHGSLVAKDVIGVNSN